MSWPRKMINNAWMWADKQPGRTRTNLIHGEEEIRFVLRDLFEFMDEEGEAYQQEGAFDLEAWS